MKMCVKYVSVVAVTNTSSYVNKDVPVIRRYKPSMNSTQHYKHLCQECLRRRTEAGLK